MLEGILDPDNGVNSDTDSLTDWEEVDTARISWDTDGSVILPTIQDCIGFVEKGYAEEGLTRYKQEHPVIGMPLSDDTDGDLLKDGLEFSLGYDPLHPNPDGDEYSDFEEYHSGKDPYVYEWETTLEEHVGAMGYGVIFGDFADDSLINTDVLIGQMGGSFFPIISDLRDVIANAIKGDVFMMAMSGVGLVPIAGDAVKTVANLGQTIAKMGDDIPAITKLIIGVAENNPKLEDRKLKKRRLFRRQPLLF